MALTLSNNRSTRSLFITSVTQQTALQDLPAWISDNSLILGLIAAVSLASLALTVLATPWLVAKLPADYWQERRAINKPASLTRLCICICRAFLGGLIMLTGLVMMVTPGPGMVMLLLGISVAEFPGKTRLLAYLATRPRIFSSLNWMRRRHGRQPFIHPKKPQ